MTGKKRHSRWRLPIESLLKESKTAENSVKPGLLQPLWG